MPRIVRGAVRRRRLLLAISDAGPAARFVLLGRKVAPRGREEGSVGER
jgi:hypothetical protein